MRRPPRSTLSSSSAASDVYKRQVQNHARNKILNNPIRRTLNLGFFFHGFRYFLGHDIKESLVPRFGSPYFQLGGKTDGARHNRGAGLLEYGKGFTCNDGFVNGRSALHNLPVHRYHFALRNNDQIAPENLFNGQFHDLLFSHDPNHLIPLFCKDFDPPTRAFNDGKGNSKPHTDKPGHQRTAQGLSGQKRDHHHRYHQQVRRNPSGLQQRKEQCLGVHGQTNKIKNQGEPHDRFNARPSMCGQAYNGGQRNKGSDDKRFRGHVVSLFLNRRNGNHSAGYRVTAVSHDAADTGCSATRKSRPAPRRPRYATPYSVGPFQAPSRPERPEKPPSPT
eukprot:TRINITY_DN17766_c0_g1_i2.p1 TRINITY_DN17766_c0_g1~~TRINITY_DN17766_c0_g1_i2.p1  ORF type:complete len:334 (-),score=36.88 TRINITY_DN17766_c0_g1_i2:852-1853(-)